MSQETDIMQLRSCDTFVALPPVTNGCVIFGKNSDRPGDDVHEVVYRPGGTYSPGEKLQCTYIEVDQVPSTRAVFLCKPAYIWGTEIGANDKGVCIGNEAVWTKVNNEEEDLVERLLGMDLVRLGLERGSSARESLDVMTSLIAAYGQGGNCCYKSVFTYHNSFLIADTMEAWVLETAGSFWVAQRVTEGVRNISNQLTIGTDFDLASPDLVQQATDRGLYNPDDGPFNFAKVFALKYEEEQGSTTSRYYKGKKLLEEMSAKGNFGVEDMVKLLSDEDSGINMRDDTRSSMVSFLPNSASVPCCHWLTATPDPTTSLFKPFIFGPNVRSGSATVSPDYGKDDPRFTKPRFQKLVNREHQLYASQKLLREKANTDEDKGKAAVQKIKELESNCLTDMDEILKNWQELNFVKVSSIFEHMCELEMNFHKEIE